MKRVIALSCSIFFLLNNAFAKSPEEIVCSDTECFNRAYEATKPIDISAAPTYVWRPGAYHNNNSARSDSGFGWFGSSGGGWSWGISVPRRGPAHPNGTFIFYTGQHSYGVYDKNGDLVKSGRASGGMSYCPDVGRSCRTPVGSFRVYNKGPADCISNKYPLGEGGAPMPHCMYFNGGYAIHGSYHVPNYHASHGCIRLQPNDAAWLYNNFMRVGTRVIVKPY